MIKTADNRKGQGLEISQQYKSDGCHISCNEELSPNNVFRIGAILNFFGQEFEVMATEFERDAGFTDAVALVKPIGEHIDKRNGHLQTPWGMVRIKN